MLLLNLKIFLLSFINPQTDSIAGKYSSHSQSCAFDYAINDNYQLEIKGANQFLLTKSVFDSRNKKTNYDLTTGTWTLNNNTIIFYLTATLINYFLCLPLLSFTAQKIK